MVGHEDEVSVERGTCELERNAALLGGYQEAGTLDETRQEQGVEWSMNADDERRTPLRIDDLTRIDVELFVHDYIALGFTDWRKQHPDDAKAPLWDIEFLWFKFRFVFRDAVEPDSTVRASRALPAGYKELQQVDLGERLTVTRMSIGSAGLFLASLVFSTLLVYVARPDVDLIALVLAPARDLGKAVAAISVLVVASLVSLSVHELCHALELLSITGEWPRFRFRVRSLSFCAEAPEWYLPVRQHAFAALAPFIVFLFIGILLIAVLPPSALPLAVILVAANSAGTVGDFVVALEAGRVFAHHPVALVREEGNKCTYYAPSKSIVGSGGLEGE